MAGLLLWRFALIFGQEPHLKPAQRWRCSGDNYGDSQPWEPGEFNGGWCRHASLPFHIPKGSASSRWHRPAQGGAQRLRRIEENTDQHWSQTPQVSHDGLVSLSNLSYYADDGRHWISSPTMDRSVIEARHRDIEEMLAPANQALVEELSMSYANVAALSCCSADSEYTDTCRASLTSIGWCPRSATFEQHTRIGWRSRRWVQALSRRRGGWIDVLMFVFHQGIEQLIALRELECKQCEQFSLSFLSNIVSIWDESITEYSNQLFIDIRESTLSLTLSPCRLNRLLSSTIDFELSQQERRISILDGVFPQVSNIQKFDIA